jgi:hypothetical protein
MAAHQERAKVAEKREVSPKSGRSMIRILIIRSH